MLASFPSARADRLASLALALCLCLALQPLTARAPLSAAYAPLQKGQLASARNGAAIAGGISLVFGIIDIFLGGWLGVVFALLCAALLGLAWNQMKS